MAMTKPKQITHYCNACEQNHTLIEGQFPYWKQHDEKWYCSNKGMYCDGCRKVHRRTPITKNRTDPKTKVSYWLCQKWFKQIGNGQIDWRNWSQQEVLSGVHFGEKRHERYGRDTEDFDIQHKQEVEALGQALDEVEGY